MSAAPATPQGNWRPTRTAPGYPADCAYLPPAKWGVSTHNPAGQGLFKIEKLRSRYLSQSQFSGVSDTTNAVPESPREVVRVRAWSRERRMSGTCEMAPPGVFVLRRSREHSNDLRTG